MRCLCCGAAADVGALCRRCAHDVAPCEGLIADHVRSTVDPTDAEAWLVDGFGGAHAIGARATIGRNQDGAVVVLAASVSREHAELVRGDAGWTARDLGSRNGTLVGGARISERTPLPARVELKIGDVALWFLAEVADEPSPPVMMETGGAGAGIARYQLRLGGVELCVLGGDASGGGALLSRAAGPGDSAGSGAWTERGLAPLEFQLLRTLCARAHDEAQLPSAVRGCVATKQLARDLPFLSKYANEENVRQVVRRLRSVLAEAGADGALAVVPGRGYYIACSVALA